MAPVQEHACHAAAPLAGIDLMARLFVIQRPNAAFHQDTGRSRGPATGTKSGEDGRDRSVAGLPGLTQRSYSRKIRHDFGYINSEDIAR
jgi:hypothetical protein